MTLERGGADKPGRYHHQRGDRAARMGLGIGRADRAGLAAADAPVSATSFTSVVVKDQTWLDAMR
ncbi:MAG: hypothetical protein U1E59_01990 [Amaricoccus sp.]